MPDENLSPESQEEESVGISGEEEESSARRRSGRYSPHSTTTTGTTPPSRKRRPVTPKTEEEEDEEEERAAAAHAGSSATSDSDVDTSADLAAATTPLKQVLVAAIKLSGSISRQHSDRALQIVTDLLIGAVDAAEFQQRVTQLVHLPFRPLVLPLLDKHLNWLRRELAARLHPVRLLAQHSSGQQQQTTTHFVKEHVKALLSLDRQLQLQDSTESSATQLGVWQVFQPGVEQSRSPGASGTAAPASVMSEATQLQAQPHNNCSNNSNTRKRRASASLVENGGGSAGDDAVEETRKRVALYSTHPPVWIPPKQQDHPATATDGGRQLGREMSSTKSSSSFSYYPSTLAASFQPQQGDEEWANIHTMLNCILSMVEKTRRALGILQQRASNDKQLQQQQKRRESSSSSLIHHQVTYEASELRRQAGELIAQTLKATEDRVSQVKRKAEEAVHDVRRAAMAELQRALSAERLRAERLAAEARRQGAEEALCALGQHAAISHHPTPPANKEMCWNCGRRANETCSGCNVARYCSTFCQHKHWEIHHKICGRVSQVMLAAAAPSTGSSMDHQSESGGSPSSSSQQHHRNSSKTPSPVQQTNGSGPASYVH